MKSSQFNQPPRVFLREASEEDVVYAFACMEGTQPEEIEEAKTFLSLYRAHYEHLLALA